MASSANVEGVQMDMDVSCEKVVQAPTTDIGSATSSGSDAVAVGAKAERETPKEERRNSNPFTAFAQFFSPKPLIDTQMQAGFTSVWDALVAPRLASREVWATHVMVDRPVGLGLSLWVQHIAILDRVEDSLSLVDHKGVVVARGDISHSRVFRKHGDTELHVVTVDCDVMLRLASYRQRDQLLAVLQQVRTRSLREREAKLRANPFIRYGKKVAWIGRRRVEDILRDQERAQESDRQSVCSSLSDASCSTADSAGSDGEGDAPPTRRWLTQKLGLSQKSTEDLLGQLEAFAGGLDAAERTLFLHNMARMTDALVEENHALCTQQLLLRAHMCV